MKRSSSERVLITMPLERGALTWSMPRTVRWLDRRVVLTVTKEIFRSPMQDLATSASSLPRQREESKLRELRMDLWLIPIIFL